MSLLLGHLSRLTGLFLILGVIILLYPGILHAQQPFQRITGLPGNEGISSLLPVSDGYLAAGNTDSRGAGKNDIMLLKTKLDFSTEWCRIYGGSDHDYPHSLIQCSDGGYLIVGRTESFGEGDEDVLVIKFNASFGIEWKKTYGKTFNERGYCVIETPNGYLIGGETETGKGGLVFEIDLNGTLRWSKTYGFHQDSFKCFNVLLADDGNYIFDGPYSSMTQDKNYMLMKIDPNGTMLWAKSYNMAGDDRTSDIVKVPDGYYVLGHSDTYGSGSWDLNLIKTDINGNFLWSKSYGNILEDMWASQMLLTSDNELILSCHTDLANKDLYDIVVLRCDLDGNLLWGQSYGTAGYENLYTRNETTIVEVHSNLFTLVGKIRDVGQTTEDVYFVGFDKDGHSACNESTYPISVSSHTLSVDNVALPVEDFNPGTHIPALILDDIVLVDSLLCPHDLTPVAIFSASNTNLCAGDCADFFDQSINDPSLWEWSFEGASPVISSDTSPANICYADTGCFDVQLIVTNFAGADTLLMEDYICVSAGPEFSLGNDTTLCFGDSMSLQAPANFPYYLWNTGSTEPQIVVSQTGEYWLEVEDSYGCSSSDTINVQINNEIIIDLGPDTTLCTGDSLRLLVPPGYSWYLWSTGSTAAELMVKQEGAYWLEVEDIYGCSSSDTIRVDFRNEINISIGPDTTLCSGDSILLSAPPGFQSYYWQDGSTAREFLVKQEGAYWVEVSNDDGCSGSDTAYIAYAELPVVNLGSDTLLCNTGLLLEAGDGYDKYLWQDGSSGKDLLADTSGMYWVEVSNAAGCKDADTIVLEVVKIPEVFLGDDTFFCKEISLLLDAGNDYDHYQWQDGSVLSTFLAEQAGVFWVHVDLKGCAEGDTIVIIEDCPSLIWFPNSFTPNGDGKNDDFKPVYDNIKEYKLLIYNRWGGLVFESNDIDVGWDGKISGNPAPTGVYVFKVNYRDEQKAKNETISDVLTLLR